MTDNFYRAFEERYYAPRETIKLLRRQYIPFVQPLAESYPGSEAFDVGCGRGEWLELMLELNLSPFGVDLDKGMLSACSEIGLPAQQGDAVVYLASLPSDSQAVVSAFHVIEHITFEELRKLVIEALRVLKPGGLLIMETPNPENLIVATQNFFLDPTHQRPIPSKLLTFVCEYTGFARIKTLRLQEAKELLDKNNITLYDVISGVSPDYAVVAQKEGPENLFNAFETVFDREYGLALDTLTDRYQLQADAKTERAQFRAERAEAKAERAEAASKEQLTQLGAVYNSRSWRITAPLRWLVRQLSLLRQHGAKARLNALGKKILRRFVPVIATRPKLRRLATVLTEWIGISERLKPFVRSVFVSAEAGPHGSTRDNPVDRIRLSPRAVQIYEDLKKATEQPPGGNR
jgi:SAM-dependent methyltransferase